MELAYSAHVKFILVGAAVVMCAIALDLSLEASKQLTAELFGSRTEYDADADALEKVADRAESEGLISKYSFAFWTDSLNTTSDSAVPSGMWLEFGGAISGNMKVSFQAARSIG